MMKRQAQQEENNYTYLCTQHRSIKYIKHMITDQKGGINSNTVIVGDFTISFSTMVRSSGYIIQKHWT